jgi:hypothetical protein
VSPSPGAEFATTDAEAAGAEARPRVLDHKGVAELQEVEFCA